MSREFGNPVELFDSVQHGFSQAVSARGSRIVSVSGQVAWSADQSLTGKDDLGSQTAKALDNLETALKSVRAGIEDVVSLRIYIVDYTRKESDEISQALKSFFPESRQPAATWVGVSCLAHPDFRIEIEAMAVVDD